jgi:DNA mismatch endonuclease, patch repair protein
MHARGFRYKLHVSELPGRPDIVFPCYSAALEVRGCFWHSHSCLKGREPKRNVEYWLTKLANNRARDVRNARKLRRLGYRVKVVWECQLRDEEGVAKIAQAIANWLRK